MINLEKKALHLSVLVPLAAQMRDASATSIQRFQCNAKRQSTKQKVSKMMSLTTKFYVQLMN